MWRAHVAPRSDLARAFDDGTWPLRRQPRGRPEVSPRLSGPVSRPVDDRLVSGDDGEPSPGGRVASGCLRRRLCTCFRASGHEPVAAAHAAVGLLSRPLRPFRPAVLRCAGLPYPGVSSWASASAVGWRQVQSRTVGRPRACQRATAAQVSSRWAGLPARWVTPEWTRCWRRWRGRGGGAGASSGRRPKAFAGGAPAAAVAATTALAVRLVALGLSRRSVGCYAPTKL
jgi:hypothetical protein